MIQRRDSPRFLLEALPVLLFESLDRDDAIQPRVSRLPHFAHTAGTNRQEQHVRTELRSGRPGNHLRFDFLWLIHHLETGRMYFTARRLHRTPRTFG